MHSAKHTADFIAAVTTNDADIYFLSTEMEDISTMF